MPLSPSVPASLDFVHYQGDTFRRSLLLDVDIVGWTWQGEARRSTAGDDPDADATFAFTQVGNKEVVMELTATQTAVLSGAYVYDVEATTAEGDVFTIVAGKLTVLEEVTP